MPPPEKLYILLLYIQRLAPGRNFEHLDSLGIMTLAAFLEDKGYRARTYTGITTDALRVAEEEIGRENLGAIGLTCDYDNQSAVISFARAIKGRHRIPIIVGGPQAFHLRSGFLREARCDFLIKGDGEQALFELLECLGEGRDPSASIAGLTCFDRDGVERENPPRPPGRNLDGRPFPRTRYRLRPGKRRALSVIGSRGCPYRCSFCFEGGNTKRFRPRSVGDVMAEIRLGLEENPEARYLMFQDDTFTQQPDRTLAFARELAALRRTRDFVWFCEAHPGFLVRHPEVLPEMIGAGLQRMQIGFESGCRGTLDQYRKGISPEQLREAVRLCWDAGLPQLAGNFIIGGPGEEERTLTTTRDFILEILNGFPGMLDLSTTFINPLPNTEITRQPEKFGMIITDPEMCTSLEDYPVNETLSLDRVAICRARRNMVEAISATMKRQYAEGLIPAGRMKRHFELALRYGVSSSWFNYVFSRDEVCMSYHTLLLFTSARGIDEARPEELQSAFPLRVADPEGIGPGRGSRLGALLSADDRRILGACDGKTRLDALAALFSGRSGASAVPPDPFLSRIDDLSRRRWLVFFH